MSQSMYRMAELIGMTGRAAHWKSFEQTRGKADLLHFINFLGVCSAHGIPVQYVLDAIREDLIKFRQSRRSKTLANRAQRKLLRQTENAPGDAG